MILQKLEIEMKTYGEYKGQYKGVAKFGPAITGTAAICQTTTSNASNPTFRSHAHD